MLPEAAGPYWRRQQQITAVTVALAVRTWQRSRRPEDWRAAVPMLTTAISRAQASAASAASEFISDVLREQRVDVDPVASIDHSPLIGVSGNGVPIDAVLDSIPDLATEDADRVRERIRIVEGVEPSPGRVRVAVDGRAQTRVRLITQTTLSDTGRAAESLEIAVRPTVGYVRMLNPPSCSRCVVLAGARYRWSDGFERHPGCDCRHVPVAEARGVDDLTVDPRMYFDSLTEAEQDKAFTKAGAQAIRDGADIGQVVNARSGMRTAQVYGRDLLITSSSTTKRGRGGRAIRARGRNPETTPRLMPESIYEIADDHDDAIRLLRMNGYLADDAKKTKKSAAAPVQPPRKPPPPTSSAPQSGGDFERDREAYRATAPADRPLDPRFADDLGTVFDRLLEEGTGPGEQLARDLSGVVEARGGRFVVDFDHPTVEAERIVLNGKITRDGQHAGLIARTLRRVDGAMTVDNDAMLLEDAHQGKGFATAFAPMLEDYYRRSGVERINVYAAVVNGGYTWARQDFRWNAAKIDESISNIVQRLSAVLAIARSVEDRQALTEMIGKLVDERGIVRDVEDLPNPAEIADLATSQSPELGRTVMIGSQWHGVKKLRGA